MTDYSKWDQFDNVQLKIELRENISQDFRDDQLKSISTKMNINEKIITDAIKASEILHSVVQLLIIDGK